MTAPYQHKTVQRIIYTLECRHAAPGISTIVSGKIFCPWHQVESSITGVVLYEWRAICSTCTYARWAGVDPKTAGIFANGHSRRNPDHKVDIDYALNPEAVRTQEKMDRYNGRKHVS
jgi:hypothetical protein